MAIQPDVYPGRKTIKNPGQAPGPKTTQNPGQAPGQKAIQDPGPGPGQSLQDPGHLPRLPPPGTATGYRAVAFSTFDPSAVNVRASVLTHPLTSPAVDFGPWHITCTGCTICKIF